MYYNILLIYKKLEFSTRVGMLVDWKITVLKQAGVVQNHITTVAKTIKIVLSLLCLNYKLPPYHKGNAQ